MNFLRDDYMEIGNDFETFEKELKTFSIENTRVKTVNMNEIYFLSVSDFGTELVAVPLHAANIWKKTKTALSLKKYPIEKNLFEEKGYDPDVNTESIGNGLYMLFSKKKLSAAKLKEAIYNGDFIPVSEKAMSTISSRVNCFGNGLFSEHLIRDLAVAKKFDKAIPVSVVLRKDSDTGLEKVFAVMSQKYTEIPQSLIIDLISSITKTAEKDLGKTICAGWSISHSVTRYYMEFPEAGDELKITYDIPYKMVPGVMIETSDIGDCSLRVRGYYRITDTNSIFYMEEEYAQMHIGEVSAEEMMKSVNSIIFPKFTFYPERLAKLMMIDIVTEEDSPATKKRVLSSLYRKVSREIGLVKAIKKNKEKVIMEQLIEEINDDLSYTAYDVAMTFLTLPNQIETKNKALIDAVSKTVVNVFTYPFDEKEENLLVV